MQSCEKTAENKQTPRAGTEKQKNRGPLDSWGAVTLKVVVSLPFISTSIPQTLHTFRSKTLCLSYVCSFLFLSFLIPLSNSSLPFSHLLTKQTALLPLLQLQNVFQMHSRTKTAALLVTGKPKKLLQLWHSFSTGLTVVPEGLFFSSKALLNTCY